MGRRDTSHPLAPPRPRAAVGILVGILVLLASGPVPSHAAPDADLVLVGGRVHTLADDRPSTVEALAIAGGRVIAAGSEAEIRGHVGPATEVLELEGATAVPGLVDAHAHVAGLGRSLGRAQLRGTTSAEECVQRLRRAARDVPEGLWLLGRGWDQNDWATPVFPTREILDEAFGDRPVALRRIDGHALWVNSAALAAAGIDADTPDPEGGEILRDPETGEPTGILVDAAEELVDSVLPEPGVEEWKQIYQRSVAEITAAGLTSAHEMGIDLTQLEALDQLDAEGALDLRVVVYLGGESVLEAYAGGPRGTRPSDLVRVEGVKLYADGALGSRGAALLEDYSDRPGHRGLLVTPPEVLTRASASAFSRGLGVAIHAIGDRGNRIALDALVEGHRRALRLDPTLEELPHARARVEHAQVLHPDDLHRFASTGIIPSMQPTHCTSDMPWADERLGEDRLEGAYAWRSLVDLGCLLPLGSDFPVEEVSPLLGLWAARTRRPPENPDHPGWSTEQCLDPLQVLMGFTVWPAEALAIDDRGRLTPGSRADVTVLDVDPLADDARRLLEAQVLWTLVEGRVVHARD